MARSSPYQGLEPFHEGDGDYFEGRAPDTRMIVANLFASPLVVLHGPGGVGKTSILNAGVIPELRARGVRVEIVRNWSSDPAEAIQVPDAPDAYRIVLILDQFEDALACPGDEPADALVRALGDPRVAVLVAVRAESLAELDRWADVLPRLFDTVLRLDYLARAGGAEAIRAPLAQWPEPAEAEGELVEAVLDGVRAGGPDARGIETAHLQLVMQRVWVAERDARSSTLRARTLERLGGPEGIVAAHVLSALDALEPSDRDLAALALDRLVTPSGMRIAQRTSDLASIAGVKASQLAPILERLTQARVLRPADAPDGPRHEVFHELLAGPIVRWLRERAAERRAEEEGRVWRRRVRTAMLVALCAIVVAIAAGIALYARSQHGIARSRGLAASAQRLLAVDPALSLALAHAAVEERRTSGATSALRAALMESQERASLRSSRPLRTAGLSDGALLAAGDAGNAVVHQGTESLVQPGGASYAAFCPDRAHIAYGGDGGAFLRTDAGTIRLGDITGVSGLACDAGGTRIVAQDSAGRTEVFDNHGDRLQRLSLSPGFPGGVQMSDDGRFFIETGDEGSAVWRVGARAPVARLRAAASAALNRDASRAVTGGVDGTITVWDVRDARPMNEIAGHRGRVTAVAIAGGFIVSGGEDRTARVWDAATGASVTVLRGHSDAVVSVDVEDRMIATASVDGSARRWAIPVARVLTTGANVVDATLSDDGRRVLGAAQDGTVRVWTADGRELARYGVPGVALVAASADGTRAAAVGSEPSKAYLLSPGAPPVTLGGTDRLAFTAAAVSPDGRAFALGTFDGRLMIADARGHIVHAVRTGDEDEVVALAFSGGGRRIAVGHHGGHIVEVAAGSGAIVRTRASTGSLVSVSYAPRGELIAGGLDAVRVFVGDNGRVRQTIADPVVGRRSATLSRDGGLLLSAGRDGAAWLTDVRSGAALAMLPATVAEFSASGELILAAGPDRAIRLYECAACGPVDELMRRAEQRRPDRLKKLDLDVYAG